MYNRGKRVGFMAKTNFTKVEEVLEEGLRLMTVQHLHALADSLSSIDSQKIDKSDVSSLKKLITILKFELNWMKKNNISLEKRIGIKKSDVKKLIEKAPPYSDEDLRQLKEIKEKIQNLKSDLEKQSPVTNDQLVEKERIKHINKRFNTNDKWLPLH